MPVVSKPAGAGDKTITDAIRQKFEALLQERFGLKEQLRVNGAAVKDAIAAGRLFELHLELPPDMVEGGNLVRIPKPPNPMQPSLFGQAATPSIREVVLDYLKQAGGKGVKASELRKAIEKKTGRTLHYKTVGMTLYRLSEKGLSRREGWIWYYVPQGAE